MASHVATDSLDRELCKKVYDEYAKEPASRDSDFLAGIMARKTDADAAKHQAVAGLSETYIPDLKGFSLQEVEKKFSTYLSSKLARSVQPFVSFKKLAGGMSKETYMCTLDASDEFGYGTELVIRMDFSHGPTDFSVLDEYPFQKMAGEAGIPVPAVVYREADESHLGQPFVVMQRCPGVPSTPLDYNLTNWADNAEDKRNIALQIAENLGKFHAIPVQEDQLQGFEFKEYLHL